MRVLLDTCVLFDIIGRRMSFKESLSLLMPHAFGDVEIWVCGKSYTDIFCIMSKTADSKAIQQAFLGSMEQFEVCGLDKASLKQAAERAWPDFEDCLVAVCAEKVGADVIVTRDKGGFSRSKVPAIEPAELLDYLASRGLTYEEVAV